MPAHSRSHRSALSALSDLSGMPHAAHWPAALPWHLTLPETNVFRNAEVSALRYPNKPFIIFYGTTITFAGFKDEAERIAGFLQQECQVKAGERVLLYMQNSPQWIIAYYGILRANAVVVPVNPMNMTGELAHYVEDSGATTIIAPQCLFANVEPLIGNGAGGACSVPVISRGSHCRVIAVTACPCVILRIAPHDVGCETHIVKHAR